jgi:hypothetical protein
MKWDYTKIYRRWIPNLLTGEKGLKWLRHVEGMDITWILKRTLEPKCDKNTPRK